MPNNSYGTGHTPAGFLKPYGADFGAGVNTRLLTMATENGATTYYLWIDSSGRLRIKSSVPTTDTDGAVVGSQA